MNMNELKALSIVFQINIFKKSLELFNSVDADNICQIMKDEAEKFARGRQNVSRIFCQDDYDIKALDGNRKTLGNKENKSLRE